MWKLMKMRKISLLSARMVSLAYFGIVHGTILMHYVILVYFAYSCEVANVCNCTLTDRHPTLFTLVLLVSLVETMYTISEDDADNNLAIRVCVYGEGEIQLPPIRPDPFIHLRGVYVILRTRNGTAMCTSA